MAVDRQYSPTAWEDRVLDQNGNVIVPGTPVNEINLGNIETGIQISHLDIGSALLLALQTAALAQKELDKIKNQRILQGQSTISNPSGAGSGYFRSSEPFVSIPIPSTAYAQINAPNYDVQVEAIDGDGSEGNLVVYGKTQNGFNVKMTGSAKSVSFFWTLINPNV